MYNIDQHGDTVIDVTTIIELIVYPYKCFQTFVL